MLSATNLEQSRQDELAADHFSGFVLFKLGVPLKQVQDTLKAFPDVYDERFSRYPKHENRVAEIAAGYNDAAAEQVGKSAPRYSYVLRGIIEHQPCGSNTVIPHKVDRIITEPYLREFKNLYGNFVSVSVEATQLTNGKPCGKPATMGISPHQHLHVPELPDDPALLSVDDQGTPGPYFKGGWMGGKPKDSSGCIHFEIGFAPSTACDNH